MDANELTDEEIVERLLSQAEQEGVPPIDCPPRESATSMVPEGLPDNVVVNRDQFYAQPQFFAYKISVRELMLLTFACAAAVALVNSFGVWGTLTLFGCGITIWALAYSSDFQNLKTRWSNEVLWGCILPIACMVTDPGVFHNFKNLQQFQPLVAPEIYILLGWQIFNLSVSWFVAGASPGIRAWFSGTFAFGATYALYLGVILSPLSTAGLYVVIGILGYTPLVTSYIYGSRARRFWLASDSSPYRTPLALAGFLGSIIIPGCVMLSFHSKIEVISLVNLATQILN